MDVLIIGESQRTALNALNEIISNEISPVIKRAPVVTTLQDGTRYVIKSASVILRGVYFDQIILVPGENGIPVGVMGELPYILTKSCVPEEFQIQYYDY